METLTNSFHRTSVRVKDATKVLDILSALPSTLTRAEKRLARRVRDRLCGSATCTCGTVR